MRRHLRLALLVAVLMFGGVVGLFLSHTSAQQPRLVHLAQGWNLVTWTGANQSAPGALASLGDAVSAVYGYNSDSQSFARYVFGRPEVSTLTDLESEHAYWVLAQRPMDWSVPSGVGPSCPTTTPCPAATPCPSCPTPSVQSELCTSYKMGIELDTIWLEIAEEGRLVGRTADQVRDELQELQRNFNQSCQGVTLTQPSLVTGNCAIAGKWLGIEDTTMLYAPSAQDQVWGNQFRSIVEIYCMPG